MSQDSYWYGFRHRTSNGNLGEWVLCGPFNSKDDAKADRKNSKAIDCYVGAPFSAASEEEARQKVHIF